MTPLLDNLIGEWLGCTLHVLLLARRTFIECLFHYPPKPSIKGKKKCSSNLKKRPQVAFKNALAIIFYF